MKNKTIIIKSGIDPEQPEFQEYYQNLKKLEVKTYFLDCAVSKKSELLSHPIAFNGDEYSGYDIDDISFFWYEQRIIGHQVLNMTKTRNAISLGHNIGNHLDPEYLNNSGYRRRCSRLEYYCEFENIRLQVLQYCADRTSGKLESEFVIPYEKQITIQKPQS